MLLEIIAHDIFIFIPVYSIQHVGPYYYW